MGVYCTGTSVGKQTWHKNEQCAMYDMCDVLKSSVG